jgi:protease I
MALKDKRIVIVLGPQYQDEEGGVPLEFLLENGAKVDVVGLEKGVLKGLHGRAAIEVNMTFDEADVEDYDAMVIPGGRGPANLRKHSEAVEFVRKFNDTGNTIAAICHGPQMLASAGLLEGRTITAYQKLKDEMVQAGAEFKNEPVIIDANFITSRDPGDLPQFDDALEKALS